MNEDRLRRLLDEAAPAAPDGQTMLDVVRPGFRRARRRRQTRLGVLGAVALMALVVGAGIAIDRDDQPSDLDLRATADSGTDGPDILPSPEDGAAGADDVPADEPTGEIRSDDETPDHLTPDRPTGDPEPVSSDEDSTSASVTSSSPPAPTTPPTTTSAPASQLTEVTEGGTVTAALVDGAITIVGFSAVDGWTDDIEYDGPDEVKVEFEQGEARIRVRFDLEDGVLVSSVEREGSDDEPDHD
jgi:hypothetical protein